MDAFSYKLADMYAILLMYWSAPIYWYFILYYIDVIIFRYATLIPLGLPPTATRLMQYNCVAGLDAYDIISFILLSCQAIKFYILATYFIVIELKCRP